MSTPPVAAPGVCINLCCRGRQVSDPGSAGMSDVHGRLEYHEAMLVLDFDGTVTDAEREGAPYRAGFLDDLAALTGMARGEVMAMAERMEAEMLAHPGRHSWVYRERTVAPAATDPYLRTLAVASAVLDAAGMFPEHAQRERLLELLYRYNYQKTAMAFRPGAYELVSGLAGAEVHVVTNSHTEPVQHKIRALARTPGELDWLVERVHGRARKFVVDDSLVEVDEHLSIDGLERSVLLRRRHYHDVLAGLLARAGRTWAELLVVGDTFELDLALPLARGARVALMLGEHTPAHEIAFLEAHPRGHVVRALSEIHALL